MRKELPFGIGLIASVTVLLDYFFDVPILSTWAKEVLNWRVLISAFALLIGIGNLTRIHVRRVARKDENWLFSAWLIIALYAYLFVGIFRGTQDPVYTFFYSNVYQPLSGTWYSITVFYMTSACWRAFRMRNAPAAVMLITAMVMMFGTVGIGSVIWPKFPQVAAWINAIPTTAGMRGITIGGALGMISLSLRVVIGLERGHLGGLGE